METKLVDVGVVYNTYMSGTYDVSLEVTTSEGCTADTSIASYVTVTSRPEAAFTFTPQLLDVMTPIVDFSNSSLNADNYTWNFGDGSPLSFVNNPSHQYPEVPEQYTVTLIRA